jgi:hypothetical protein
VPREARVDREVWGRGVDIPAGGARGAEGRRGEGGRSEQSERFHAAH